VERGGTTKNRSESFDGGSALVEAVVSAALNPPDHQGAVTGV